MATNEAGRRPIDRASFLYARMAYLASLRSDGASETEMMRACNLGDIGQVRLLLATWDSGSSLPGESTAEQGAISAAAAVSDEWHRMLRDGQRLGRAHGTAALRRCLDALESATRNSPLRQVKP